VEKEVAGRKLFESALVQGEKLFESTSPDGREGIRSELRELTLQWESWTENLASIKRYSEQSAAQLDRFESQYTEALESLNDLEQKVQYDIITKNTLQEKQLVLRHNTVGLKLLN